MLVLDNKGISCMVSPRRNMDGRVMFDVDNGGFATIEYFIASGDGMIGNFAKLALFDTWWPEPVALHTLAWDQEFYFVGDGQQYTLDRGNGMYMWVIDQQGNRMNAYIGSEVIGC